MFGITIKQQKNKTLYEDYYNEQLTQNAIDYAVMDVVAVSHIWENMQYVFNVDDQLYITVGRVQLQITRQEQNDVAKHYHWCPYDVDQMLSLRNTVSIVHQ